MGVQHILAVVQSDLQLIGTLRRVLEKDGFSSITVARSSQEAILYLRGVGIYQDRFHYPIPSVVILDCQNPEGVDLDVLAFMRDRTWLSNRPLILLCSEHHQPHVTCALDSSCFLVDRDSPAELLEVLHSLDSDSKDNFVSA